MFDLICVVSNAKESTVRYIDTYPTGREARAGMMKAVDSIAKNTVSAVRGMLSACCVQDDGAIVTFVIEPKA